MTNGEPGSRYARRWLAHAWRATWRWVRTSLGLALIGIVGAGAAVWLGAPLIFGSDGIRIAFEEIVLILLGTVGSAIAVFFVRFVVELFNAPAAMERAAAAHADVQQTGIERELDEERRRHANLRERTDASRLRLSVGIEDGLLTTVQSSNDARAAFITAEGRELTAPLERSQPRTFSGLSAVTDAFNQERRSADDYMAAVRAYLTGVDNHWMGMLANAAIDREVAELRLVVENFADVGARDVEIELTLPGDVAAAWSPGEVWDEHTPERPAPWGTDTTGNALLGGYVPPSGLFGTVSDPGSIEERAGEVRIAWDVFDIAARRQRRLDPILLFAPEDYAGKSIKATWTAAAVSGGPPISGDFELAFAPEPYPAAKLIKAHRLRE